MRDAECEAVGSPSLTHIGSTAAVILRLEIWRLVITHPKCSRKRLLAHPLFGGVPASSEGSSMTFTSCVTVYIEILATSQ